MKGTENRTQSTCGRRGGSFSARTPRADGAAASRLSGVFPRTLNSVLIMKTLLPVVGAALLLLPSGCIRVEVSGSSDADLRAKAVVTRTNSIPTDIKTLEVDNSFGPVRIVGTDSEATEWEWTLTARAHTDALAQEAAESVKCDAVRDGDRLRIIVTLPVSKGDRSFESSLEIRAPKPVSVRTRTSFGRTAVAGIGGDVDAAGQHGSMEIRDVGGTVRAKTSFASLKVGGTGAATLENHHGELRADRINGTLDAETSFATLAASSIAGPVKLRDQHGKVDAGGVDGDAEITTSFASLIARDISGNATLRNQHGSIDARDIKGSVRATTSFGNLSVDGLGSHFICRNSHGSIRLRSPSAALSEIDAETSFAPLDVRLSEELKPAIQARTSYADIDSDFPVLMKPRGTDVFAELAADTPRVRLENQHGRIRITRD